MPNKGQTFIMVAGGFAVFGGLMAFANKASASTNVNYGGTRKVDSATAKTLLPKVVKWAKTFGAPPSLVMAIFANESGFNASATNLTSPGDVARGGAWGLGQLTLKTAKALNDDNPSTAKKYWPQWDGTGPGLLDPDTNIAMSAFGISQNWKRYKNWLQAGVAWNVGAGMMDKMVAGKSKTSVEAHPYGQHLLQQVDKSPVISELLAAEKSRGDTYA